MGSLYDSYSAYYSDPCLRNADRLWADVYLYDFSDYHEFCQQVSLLRKQFGSRKSLGEMSLTSSGSMGLPRHYQLGPHALYWIFQLERAVKSPEGTDSIIEVSSPLMFVNRPASFEPVTGDLPFPIRYTFRYSGDHRDYLSVLFRHLEKVDVPFVISGLPNTFLFLNAHKDFQSFVQTTRVRGLLSHDWEPFYRKRELIASGVHINDNCINWTTGVNFFTCKANQKHFFPLFVVESDGLINLMNLAEEPINSVDDLVEIGAQRSQCVCGRWYFPLRFFPHVECAIRNRLGKIVFDCELPEKLMAKYLNLQIIQTEERINIYNVTQDVNTEDHAILEDFLRSNDVPGEIVFFSTTSAMCGGKLPTFWAGRYFPMRWYPSQRFI